MKSSAILELDARGVSLLAAVVHALIPGIQSAIGADSERALLRELAHRGVGLVQSGAEPLLAEAAAGRRFDLAISLETAHPLPAGRAELLTEDLGRLSNLILFSAPIPGQRTSGDELWQDEWATQFASLGYHAIDAIRPRIWALSAIAPTIRQNTILYANLAGLERYPALLGDRVSDLARLRVVHPEIWAARLASRSTSAFPIPAPVRRLTERWLGVQ